MYFLIDSTTITLTHSIFSQALKVIFSFSQVSISTVTFLCFESLNIALSVCQLQYFSAHLKFAPIRGLHLQGKLSRYTREVIIWKISPIHKFPGHVCCPFQQKKKQDFCYNNSNLVSHKMHKTNDWFYDDVKHIMKSSKLT